MRTAGKEIFRQWDLRNILGKYWGVPHSAGRPAKAMQKSECVVQNAGTRQKAECLLGDLLIRRAFCGWRGQY